MSELVLLFNDDGGEGKGNVLIHMYGYNDLCNEVMMISLWRPLSNLEATNPDFTNWTSLDAALRTMIEPV